MDIYLIISILVVSFIVWEIFYSIYFLKKGRELAGKTYTKGCRIGNKSEAKLKVLIAGDSLGTGLGASSFGTSVAGRITKYLSKKNYVILKNISFNGNRAADLTNKPIPKEKFDLTVIFISSNDILGFTVLKKFEINFVKAIEKYSKISKKSIIIGPANVGLIRVLPIILQLIYLYMAPKYASIMRKASKKFKNIIYINSLKPPKKLGKYKSSFYSSDKFHPNDEGHSFWFEMIKQYL